MGRRGWENAMFNLLYPHYQTSTVHPIKIVFLIDVVMLNKMKVQMSK